MTLLDTHALIFWLYEPDRLGKSALKAISTSDRIGVHVITCFEMALLVEKGRIELYEPLLTLFDRIFASSNIRLVQMTPHQAIRATTLPGKFHKDPADRILAATCLLEGWPLVTKDRLISDWGMIETIWD